MVRATKGRTYIWERTGWPTFTWDLVRLAGPLAAARRSQGELLGMVRAIEPGAAQEVAVSAMAQEVVQNSAIEGVSLDLPSVRASMLLRLGVEVGMAQASGMKGVDPVVGVLTEAVKGFQEPLTLERIFGWQRALFPKGIPMGLTVLPAGALRGEETMVVASPGRHVGEAETIHFEAPGRAGLEGELERFLTWFGESLKDGPHGTDGLVRAGIAHLWFVTIHPLADGNGRIARTLTDLALAQDEQSPRRHYSLSVQIMRNKEAYYAALERAQQGGLDLTEWLVWFLHQVEAATRHGVEEVAKVVARGCFWATARQAGVNDRQEQVLKAILSPLSREDAVSNSYYCKLADTNRTTAARDLADLVQTGLLLPYGGGRSASYRVGPERFIPEGLQPRDVEKP